MLNVKFFPSSSNHGHVIEEVFAVGGECENLLGDFLSGGKNFKNSDFEHLDPF